jgi:hypothetical protein
LRVGAGGWTVPADRIHGRGLIIVGDVTDGWGYETGGSGKTVWWNYSSEQVTRSQTTCGWGVPAFAPNPIGSARPSQDRTFP